MAPSISLREYIRWFPDQASEPTSTLVVTSAENRFVDIRVLKPASEQDATGVHEHILPFERLDWAFAGTSSTELETGPDGTQNVHSKWKHWVDSRHVNAEEVNDEGDMFPQKNGTALERGSMINPATGQMTQYEECWKDLQPIPVKDDPNGACVVMQLHDDAHQARGMVVRMGQCCQGLLRVGEHLALERWVWSHQEGWTRKLRMGDLWLPCGVALEENNLKMDGEVKYGDYVWKVIEWSQF